MKTSLLTIITYTLIALPLSILPETTIGSTDVCNKILESLPILQEGRIKPLYVHARESLKYLTGKKTPIKGQDPVTTYCLLSLSKISGNAPAIKAEVRHKKVKRLLEMDSGNSRIAFPRLVEKRRLVGRELAMIKHTNSYKRSLEKVTGQMNLYEHIVSGENWQLAGSGSGKKAWVSLMTLLQTQENLAKRGVALPRPIDIFMKTKTTYIEKHGDGYLLELRYAKAHIPGICLLGSLLALASLVLFKKAAIPLTLAGILLVLQTVLITLRVLISGRAPITNMYETVLFSGYGALILGVIISAIKREKLFTYVGLGYNFCTLMMMMFAGSMLSDEIGPLVPVLRDNFWLSTHVTTVIMSYGALALSWVLSNMVLFKRRFSHISRADEKYYSDLTYTCLKFGVVLLAAGIILGGIWADYSWGRFWGWDPKETGSLIVLCLYMAILHGRHTKWIPEHRFMTLTAAAFLSVMMAWFGVNYILASGLHSYGFSQGGATFLATFFALQLTVLAITRKPVVS